MTNATLAGTATISAMDFRKQPGTILDRVYYNNESIVIKRQDEARAVVVPVADYIKFVADKMDAKKRLFDKIEAIRKNASIYKTEEIEDAIDEAIKTTRKNGATV